MVSNPYGTVEMNDNNLQNQTRVEGDRIGRDKVGGDKVGGDKVYGDKYIYYPDARPAPVEPAVIAKAEMLLAELPVDEIPPISTLPNHSRIPYKANPLFVGREIELMRLARHLKGGTTVIAFVEDPDGYKVELIERDA